MSRNEYDMPAPAPELVLLPSRPMAGAVVASMLLAAAAFGVWLWLQNEIPQGRRQTFSFTEANLSPYPITALENPADQRAALEALRIEPTQRQQIWSAVQERRLKLGLLAFWDSMDPDGDTVLVTSADVAQTVLLQKSITPVVVPYAPGRTVRITAIRDGGGAVTVAVMTANGPLLLRHLLIGESIEVATP